VRGTANFQRAKPRSYPERFAVEAQNLVLFENKEFDCAAVGVSVAVLQFDPELMQAPRHLGVHNTDAVHSDAAVRK